MQCDTMQWNATQRNATQCNAMQLNPMQCNAMQCNTTQQNTRQPQHAWLWYKLPSINLSYTYGALVHTAAVVDLAHVDQLLPPRARNLVGQLLFGQRFPRGLDDVHLVARAGRLGGEVLQAAGAGELEDQVLRAETEACELSVGKSPYHEAQIHLRKRSVPGGRANSWTFVAPTLCSRSPKMVLFS